MPSKHRCFGAVQSMSCCIGWDDVKQNQNTFHRALVDGCRLLSSFTEIFKWMPASGLGLEHGMRLSRLSAKGCVVGAGKTHNRNGSKTLHMRIRARAFRWIAVDRGPVHPDSPTRAKGVSITSSSSSMIPGLSPIRRRIRVQEVVHGVTRAPMSIDDPKNLTPYRSGATGDHASP